MRGISAIIAVVLILLITVSLAAGAYLFLSMTMSQTTTAAQQSISQTVTQMTKSFAIEAVSGGKIWVRNTGQVPISNLTIYIDGAPANTSNVVIQPGEVGVIQIYDAVDFSRPREIEIPGGTTTESKVVTGESLRDLSLVGYWKFDEGSGTTAADSSGNGNDGTLVNGPTWIADGKYGGALKFDGVNDYVYVRDSDTLDVTNNFTIEHWFRPNSSINQWDTVTKSVGGGNYEPFRINPANQSQLCFQWSNTSQRNFTCFTVNFVTGAWHHIAVTFVNGNVSLYFNGTYVDSQTALFTSIYASTGYLFIGTRNGGSNWVNGTIDEVRIYNRALSAEEIWNHYAHGPV